MLTTRGTPALHLNEPKLIIDGFNELIPDCLSQLVLFLDSLHLRLLKSKEQTKLFSSSGLYKQTNIKKIQK